MRPEEKNRSIGLVFVVVVLIGAVLCDPSWRNDFR